MKAFCLILFNQYKLQGSLFNEKHSKNLWHSHKLSENLSINSVATDGFVCSGTLVFSVNSTFKKTLGQVPRTQVDKSLVSRSINDASNNSEIAGTNTLPSNLGWMIPIDLLFWFEDLHDFLLP